jgi:negative regulator of sigma-B (phosphoserine phosphatase)
MVACAVAIRAFAGQTVCGDAHVIAPFEGGVVIAAIDGLGHGLEAAEAAQTAVGVIARCAGRPVAEILLECHGALKGTRGAALSLASFSSADRTMSWVGVGNVEAVLVRSAGAKQIREHLLLKGGIVGHNLPAPRPAVLPLEPDDTVILATDGIRPGFATELALQPDLDAIARGILARSGRDEDDALVLVARYSEGA